jgi:hypothetical protein
MPMRRALAPIAAALLLAALMPVTARGAIGPAKMAAADGRVSFRVHPGPDWYSTLKDVPVYALVVGAYRPDGEGSGFAIASSADYCSLDGVACPGTEP